jgi:hypothetical protein
MPAMVEAEAQRATVQEVPLRLLVLRDSDRTSAEAPLADQVTRLVGTAKQHGAEVHVLEKRAAENYLPDRWWTEVRSLDARSPAWTDNIDELLAMSETERDYTDMGAKNLGRKMIPAGIDPDRPYHLVRFAQRVRSAQDADMWRASLAERAPSRELRSLILLIDQRR